MPKLFNNVVTKKHLKPSKKITTLPFLILFGKYFVPLSLNSNPLILFVYENRD